MRTRLREVCREKARLLLVVVSAILAACEVVAPSSRNVFDIAEHLAAHGFPGESGGAPSEMVGAEMGIKYYGEGFEVKIFEYVDEKSAIKFETSGLAKPRFRNGKFIMLVRQGNAANLGRVFQNF